MHYVALLSGGKDSCFNLLHCAQHGHKLVAAASLGPGPDEIDSYLYQTVGQDAIQLVSDALEVPLLRRVISGAALQQGSEYGSRHRIDHCVQGDETEDLFELLSEVKIKFPEVQGVSVGAILSNYQRIRVENVCQRLSLTPLCYLWRRNQSELLSEMIGAGLEAVLIKVAGIGLTTKHLGKTLAQMQPTLTRLNSLYGAHICGEGGEYESLTLDSPLFKHRIILEDVETVIHSDKSFATVAFLKITRARLQKKSTYIISFPIVPKPSLLSDADEVVSEAVSSAKLISDPHDSSIPKKYQEWKAVSQDSASHRVGPWVVVANAESKSPVPLLSVEEEVRACFKTVQSHLAEHGLNLSHLANVMILIATMDIFPVVNVAYASFFGASPPARACVAVDLPLPTRVRLECIAYTESQSQERHSLHVQSLSYWAPANIGPYSQAITVDGRVFVSGQIGLVPANNTLPVPQSLSLEAALSLRHVRCIADVVNHNLSMSLGDAIQGVISWLVNKDDVSAVKCGMSASEHFRTGKVPTLFAVVKSLPKNALVEIQVLLHIAQPVSYEDGASPSATIPRFSRGQLPGLEACWEASSLDSVGGSLVIVACLDSDDEDAMAEGLAGVTELRSIWENVLCVRLFHTSNAVPNIHRLFHRLCGDSAPSITSIPCRALVTSAKDSWDYVLYCIA